MPQIRFFVEHRTQFGFKVCVHVVGWAAPCELRCVTFEGKVAWEGTAHAPSHTQLRYKYFFVESDNAGGHRFFEDGPDRERWVGDGDEAWHDAWVQHSDDLVDVVVRDEAGRRVHHATHGCDTMHAEVWVVTSNQHHARTQGEMGLEVHVQRQCSDAPAHHVWEHFVYSLRRMPAGFYHVNEVLLLVNDDFWNVGKALLVEVNTVTHHPDNSVRGSRHRHTIFHRGENWVGRRARLGGDDHFQGRGHFPFPHVHVDTRPLLLYCNFTRREGCRHTVLHLIHTAKHSIRASIYNINDEQVTNALIAARDRGVDVEILTSSKLLLRDWAMNREFKRLVRARVKLVGIVRYNENRIGGIKAITNHTKFAVFDSRIVATGSCNWESRAFDANSESIVVTEHPHVAAWYLAVFEAVRSRPMLHPPHNHSDSVIKLYYSRTWGRCIIRPVCDLLDSAHHHIVLAMFILRDVQQWEHGRNYSLFQSLIRAVQRGVAVWAVLEGNTHDGGKYKHRTLPADNEHRELMRHGVHCVKIRPTHNNDPCSALHHKFMVVDGHTTLTGSFNFWGPSLASDDDIMFVRDNGIAHAHCMEARRLLEWYSPHDLARFPVR